jgi:Zn-finger nucleic acid-binding protein
MVCPKCQGPMRQYERSGVTVDQCTDCRGILLDRGELDRLLDAENSWHRSAPPPQQQPQYARQYRDYDSDEYPMYGRPGQRRKRRGFLEELFD